MKRMVGWTALCLLPVLGCASGRQYETRWQGAPAPDFELAALDGGKVKLSSFRGKPVVLVFWAYG